MPKFEIQILSGRRIVTSFNVTAKDGAAAGRKSEKKRKKIGAVRYRVRKVNPGSLRHGGFHQTSHVFNNHYKAY
jgi:hypothetical protein